VEIAHQKALNPLAAHAAQKSARGSGSMYPRLRLGGTAHPSADDKFAQVTPVTQPPFLARTPWRAKRDNGGMVSLLEGFGDRATHAVVADKPNVFEMVCAQDAHSFLLYCRRDLMQGMGVLARFRASERAICRLAVDAGFVVKGST
jgi:hypothetical protein